MSHAPFHRRFVVRPVLLIVLLGAMAIAAPRALGQDAVTYDQWYVMTLEGERVGYAHLSMQEDGEHLVTRNRTHLSIRRGPAVMEIEQRSRFTETRDGEPIEAQSNTKLAQMAVRKTMRFGENEHVLITEQGGRTNRQTVQPSEQAWLTPGAAQRHLMQKLAAGAERIELQTFDLLASTEPIGMTMEVLGREDVEVMGKVVPATAWRATISTMPGVPVTEYVDKHGKMLKTTVQLMPGMEVQMLAADKQVATAEVDPPELLASMLIEPEGAIDRPRERRHAIYELKLDPSIDPDRFDVPRTGYQRVVWGDERTARVVIDLDQPVTAGNDLPKDVHRKASSMLDHEDPAVCALRDEALGDDADALDDLEKAERLRAFVERYINEKDLSVGLATASEVARTKQGDCSEHAVLLAALLRAADIPSRTATGLLYVDQFLGRTNVFGGHMWTQAWLPTQTNGGGHTWIDLDPMLPNHAYDAAHITLQVTAMSDEGPANALMEQAPLISALQVKVIQPATAP